MTRDHKIRLAVRGLRGEARARAILNLLSTPRDVEKVLRRRLREILSPKLAAENEWHAKVVSFNFRLTPEEYLSLREAAKREQVTMSTLVKGRLFN